MVTVAANTSTSGQCVNRNPAVLPYFQSPNLNNNNFQIVIDPLTFFSNGQVVPFKGNDADCNAANGLKVL